MAQEKNDLKPVNRHPMRERAAARVDHKVILEQGNISPDGFDADPDDAFVIRLFLDVVAGRSYRALFDEAGDLKEGCQSSALLAVAEGLMQSFNSDLSVKDGLMLKMSLTAISLCGYYPDIKEIPAENPHPDGEELDYDNAIVETAEPERIEKSTLQDASKSNSESNQFIIDQHYPNGEFNER